jgi:site-specific DNA recombinase
VRSTRCSRIPSTAARFGTRLHVIRDCTSRSSIRSCGTQRSLLLGSRGALREPRETRATPSPLTGKLFDQSGQSLTPTHAVKGERRYRYYVSRSLSNGTADSTERGWRLPAPEIERTVVSAACTLLDDKPAITNTADAAGLAGHQLPTIFSAAAAMDGAARIGG